MYVKQPRAQRSLAIERDLELVLAKFLNLDISLDGLRLPANASR